MQRLIILSGRSGAGKTSALHILEDLGYLCIDNLPMSLLPDIVNRLITQDDVQLLAVGIDIRNPELDLNNFDNLLREINTVISPLTIFLTAQDNKLIERFSATRRKHPLFKRYQVLSEAIQAEYEQLKSIAASANITIDTSKLNIHELKERLLLKLGSSSKLVVLFQSFGFKHGIPLDADFVFDVRVLTNPHWHLSLRNKTGKDQAVIDFLAQDADVQKMIDDLTHFFNNWLPNIKQSNRHSISIAIGCTGGKHRSVYIVETLSKLFSEQWQVHTLHRESKQWHKTLNQTQKVSDNTENNMVSFVNK